MPNFGYNVKVKIWRKRYLFL